MDAVPMAQQDIPPSLTLQAMLEHPYPHLATIIRAQRHRMNGTPNIAFIFDLICAAGNQSDCTPDGIEVDMHVLQDTLQFTARKGFEEETAYHHRFEYQPVGHTLYKVINAIRSKFPDPLTP